MLWLLLLQGKGDMDTFVIDRYIPQSQATMAPVAPFNTANPEKCLLALLVCGHTFQWHVSLANLHALS
jgi:hypothetical protein